MYNTRGKVLTGIGTTWTTVNIPFGLLAPRYLPGDPACAAGVFCEAPKFNPLSALGIQFSVYDQFTAADLLTSLGVLAGTVDNHGCVLDADGSGQHGLGDVVMQARIMAGLAPFGPQ